MAILQNTAYDSHAVFFNTSLGWLNILRQQLRLRSLSAKFTTTSDWAVSTSGREQPVWAGVPGYPGGGSDWLLAVRGGGGSCAALRRLGHARHTGNHKENGVVVGAKDI